MVRETADDAAKVIDAMPAAKKEILPGLEVFYLDGIHLVTERTCSMLELRTTRRSAVAGSNLKRS